MISIKNAVLKFVDYLLDLLETIAFSCFIVILMFTFLFRIACVYGQSMQNTLFENDRLVVSHMFYKAKAGDIVVANSDVLDETIVKRVIGISGQKIVIDDKLGKVTVDGKVTDESYLKNSGSFDKIRFDEKDYNSKNNDYEYTVPKGYVFLMGDNRDGSTDSRVIGCVSEKEIMGRVVFRLYSDEEGMGIVK